MRAFPIELRRPGIAGSLLLHAAVILLLATRFVPPEPPAKFFPVELVRVQEQTTAPVPAKVQAKPDLPRQQTASVRPQIKSAPPPEHLLLPPLRETPAAPPKGEEPVPQPPRDELQSRLEAFAKMTIPGSGTIAASGKGAAFGPSGYDLKDFIRAQVERRWSLDLERVEDRAVTVFIHVVLAPDGAIRKAEIVNDRQDVAYHSLAISARNAVLLSSPIILPAGTPATALDVVLNLSPKDTLN